MAGLGMQEGRRLYEEFGDTDLVHPLYILLSALHRLHTKHVQHAFPEEYHHESAGGVDNAAVLALRIAHMLLVDVEERVDRLEALRLSVPSDREVVEPVRSYKEQVRLGIAGTQLLQHRDCAMDGPRRHEAQRAIF